MQQKNKILILGVTGMLGNVLYDRLSQNTEKLSIYATIRDNKCQHYLYRDDQGIVEGIDAYSIASIEKVFSIVHPRIVINCIGIIKQLPTAKDPIPSIKINSLFPHQLAQFISVQIASFQVSKATTQKTITRIPSTCTAEPNF